VNTGSMYSGGFGRFALAVQQWVYSGEAEPRNDAMRLSGDPYDEGFIAFAPRMDPGSAKFTECIG